MKKEASPQDRPKPRQAENHVKTYLHDAEYGLVKQAAAGAGLSISAWIRMTILREAKKEVTKHT